MGIEPRVAVSDEDLERWRQVRLAVLPDERCVSVVRGPPPLRRSRTTEPA